LRLYRLVADDAIGFLPTIRLYFTSFFFNNLLPGTIGGDSYKVYYLKARTRSIGSSIVLVLIERVPGMILLLLIGAMYYLVNLKRMTETLEGFVRGSELPIFEFMVSIGGMAVLTAVSLLAPPTARAKVIHYIRRLLQAFLRFGVPAISEAAGWTLLAHASRLSGFYFLILGVHDVILWGDLLVVLPLVAIISSLPLSLGALGVRESAVTAGLVLFGVIPLNALAVAILFRFSTWAKSLLGAVLLLEESLRKK
jgi:glycosyltransferase 2 family protein